MGNNKRVEKVVHSMFWVGIYTVITTIMPFLTRTVLIRIWGMEYAGLSALFSSITAVLSLGEMGIGEALVYSMYKPAAEHDVQRVNALLLVYKKIYRFIGCFILAVGACLIPILPHLIEGTYPNNINLIVLYMIYLLQMAGNYFFWSYYMSIFRTHQSLYITYKWRTVLFFLMYAIQILVIYATDNYYLYALCVPICAILANFADYILTKRYYPEYHPGGRIEEGFLKDLLKRVSGMAIRKLRDSVRGSFDSLFVSSFLGLVVLAKYQNYMLVMAVPSLFFGVLNSGILQSLGNSVAVETKESNYEVVKLYSFIIQWLAMWFSTMMLNLYNVFMNLWLGTDALFKIDIVVLIVVYFYLTSLTYIPNMIRNSTGLWSEGKWIPMVESIANFILDLVLVQVWGLKGILIGTIITMIFINIPCETKLVYSLYFDKSAKRELAGYVINGVVAILASYVSYMICELYRGNALSVLFVRIMVSTVASNLIFIILHIKDRRLKDVYGIINSLIRENFIFRNHK